MEFDFLAHHLRITTSEGGIHTMALAPRSVADFYHELLAILRTLGIEVVIRAIPDEVEHPIPFADDHTHAAYDAAYAQRFWRILVQADRVLKAFRSRFIGKCSPVYFFWGACDLAVTRFSGRRAPALPDADAVTREAASHEESSCGFWPGSGPIQAPAFYAYTLPTPEGLEREPIRPSSAFWSPELSQFILLYEDVRQAEAPDDVLLEFLQSTYEAGATLAHWDRTARWRGRHKGVKTSGIAYEQVPRSPRRNALPVKRIDGALLMGHKHLAGARIELKELGKTSACTHRILQHAPEACDGVAVMSPVGR
jgi:hypothetical protein